jgi:hypothetical protein
LIEVIFAVWFVIVLMELVAFKRFSAFRANEMVRMPCLTQSRDVLAFYYFVATTASWIVGSVVAVLTVMRTIFLNESLASQGNLALHTPETIRMKRFVFCHHKSTVD